MQEELISFETAKLAEEKGFNIKQLKGFWLNSKFNKDGDEIDWLRPIKDSEILELRDSNKFETGNPFIFRPTQSLLQKWLREVHNIHIEIHYGKDKTTVWFTPKLFSLIKGKDGDSEDYYDELYEELVELEQEDSYEKALEIGLQEALKLIK